MKVLVIGHQAAVWGFALAGVAGQIAATEEEVHRALDAALAEEQVGVVLITSDAADLARSRVDTLKVRSTTPLIVEIPGPQGPDADQPSLAEVIRRTIGVKL